MSAEFEEVLASVIAVTSAAALPSLMKSLLDGPLRLRSAPCRPGMYLVFSFIRIFQSFVARLGRPCRSEL
eukprot:12216508-Alexandrium_andersonii.AAC.1